jgi:hypothetical protein
MTSMAMPEEVFDRIGDKITLALGDAVEGARDDYQAYRSVFPEHAATDAARVRFGWIHDRMWTRIKASLDDHPDVSFVDRDPIHDMWIRSDFRIRFKVHSLTGAVRSYPTTSALEFICQEPDLFGVSTINLIAGYEWLPDVQEMGDPILSLRDGSFDEVLWMVTLPTTGGASGGIVAPIVPVGDGPAAPIIEVPALDGTKDAEEAGDS